MTKLRGEKIVGNAGENLKVAQRVEVKTVLQRDDMARYSFTICKGADKRCYTRKDCDIIALAALDIRSVLFFPVESFMTVKSLTLTKNDFNNPSEKHQWSSVLDYSQDMMAEILKMQKLKKEYKIYEKV
jgi:hypothetical protein